ncbi:hypothetical protein C8A03DRAFT_14546 [Achaetomium macrosporum]|uniref:Protamine P1 n=1 Tax=Achaetomium macrosporum TaxID=79813 RepID=A0AAN7CBM4_9PEZI|nr:hypothetical protein C8A03DRAFT_14546 [Achaetomium macrosporum]
MKRCFGGPDRAWLHPKQFLNEPIYSEAPHDPDDVIYPGSDDEAYSSPTERRIRCEAQAQRFLEGKPVFLLSATLRGPFDRKSGWVNPWRSKSTCRITKRSQRNSPPSTKRAAEQHESSRIVESSNCDLRLPGGRVAPGRNTYTPARYMDDEKFHLVQAWRDKVLAEADVSASPVRCASQAEPASADSRRATQQTTRRRSDLTLDTLDDGPRSSAPFTPSVANNDETRISSGILKQKHGQMSSRSPGDARLVLAPNRATVSQNSPSSSAPAPEARITTPSDVVVENAAPSALLKTQASSRTDGSFRFRRKDAGHKGSPLGKTWLAGPPSTPSDTAGRASADKHGVRKSAGVTMAMREPIQQVDEITPNLGVQETTKDAPQSEPSQGIEKLDGQAADHGQDEEADRTETASEIDGLTLVPSQASGSSEDPSMPSFGHFSCEKHSQDVISDAVGLPGKLLWPRSQRSASGATLLLFGPESTRITEPKQPEPVGLYSGHHVLPSLPACAEQIVCQPVEGCEAIRALSEGNVEAPVQEHRSAFVEADEVPTKPSPERAAEVEIAREAEGGGVRETEQLQVWVKIEPGLEDGTEHEIQPATSRPPEVQSPWMKDDAALFPRQAFNAHPQRRDENAETADIRSSPPKATQSPWNKDADIVPSTSAITGQLPSLPFSNEKLSFIASQALEQTASQSPWARGDSQLQMPEVRLFNPLSSPAPTTIPSHDLPLADTDIHPPAPGDENVKMCDPPCPSTPETKRSGLPTPDVTLSVKSFKEFMTPSPQPAAKRRRISTITYDHLPSTQALVDAAVSNPWIKPPSTKARKQKKHKRTPKRVSWAPLPDEEEPSIRCVDVDATASSPSGAAPSTKSMRHRKGQHTPRSRAASPPPSILSTSKLPAASQKFGKHFAAVANCRVGTTPLRRTASVRLLPSASQQVCESPAVEAMAEAFIRAERGTDFSQEEVLEAGEDDSAVELMCENTARMDVDQHDQGDEEGEDEDKENAQEETQEEEQQVDDVSAVLQNLDDFLGSWNLDAELAKARVESEREKRAHHDGVGLGGSMDAGVWY